MGFDLLAEPIGVCPSPPRITLGETFEMTAQQALGIAELLRAAAHFAQQIDGQARWPRLVAES
ncbi:hypothetical protein GCM10022223_12590 [Kineosporia mesophila]|uniref:Uncharacterized protein n=1 Tax=Kineosporia mesophila TaxID=566012 RepID=A0ABP6Z7R4_9ACTN|nr:hypothetical protein [Kineosporia mesophila]MCD5355005.1 hypothetical protein [Kineosporia mesophila]